MSTKCLIICALNMRLPWDDNTLRSHEHAGHVLASVQFHGPGSDRRAAPRNDL